jgi:hypothetical protein
MMSLRRQGGNRNIALTPPDPDHARRDWHRQIPVEPE